MSQMSIEQDHYQPQEPGYQDPNSQWVDNGNGYNHSQHQSPAQEYNGFAFTPLPMEPNYSSMPPPRTTHQQLQPLIMPQWPSMLSSQSNYTPPIYPTAPVPVAPAATPVTATPTRTSSTPRKTLTDQDRRRMCLYHEEHPTVKQTEIGAMFGVERSTVSKVLRQKEKYLYQDDGSRSPIKRSKGKFPDIERALSNWARNAQRQGVPLSDSMIKEKARFFATNVGNSDSLLKANSTSWLEKFKQKNNLMGSKSRKNSVAEISESGSNPASSVQTPNGVSPTSPNPNEVASPSPIALSASKSNESLKTESPESYVDFSKGHRTPFHSQSNTSLSSVFTDTATASFSTGPISPASPFFTTPDSACGANPFMGSQHNDIPQGSSNFHRPRSQTFPMLGIEQYISPPPSSETLTPKYISSTALESPESEVAPPLGGVDEMLQPQTVNPTTSMQPPPVPTPTTGAPISIASAPPQHQQLPTPISPGVSSPSSPSQEDARRALEVVMNFFQHQPSGFVEPQEYVTIGKLMEKLKIQRNGSITSLHGEQLPGGMHRIPEQEFVRKVE